VLKHHCHTVGRPAGDRLAVDEETPTAQLDGPAMARSSVVLPQPDGPTTHDLIALISSDNW
jgi:hypothetical protein